MKDGALVGVAHSDHLYSECGRRRFHCANIGWLAAALRVENRGVCDDDCVLVVGLLVKAFVRIFEGGEWFYGCNVDLE